MSVHEHKHYGTCPLCIRKVMYSESYVLNDIYSYIIIMHVLRVCACVCVHVCVDGCECVV